MMKPECRMYKEARKTLNPFVGCRFDCTYCHPSFRRQAKRQKNRCKLCYDYIPHSHLERLEKAPPRTRKGEFIFLIDFGDPSFMQPVDLTRVLQYCEKYPDRDFLLQSKNPAYFVQFRIPKNVIIGTTLETDRDGILTTISKAPPILRRAEAMWKLYGTRKMVTIEPIIKFNLGTFAWLIKSIEPWRVYIGYDSHPKENQLPEPSLADADALMAELRSAGIDVRWKLRRRAWWEDHLPDPYRAARGA